jgi:hypothetical protein
MSRFGAASLTAVLLVATPVAAAEAPHRIVHDAAWGCRDKNELIDLLFLGLSTTFDTKLAAALGDGRCVYFKAGEGVTIVEEGRHGLVRVQREDATPVSYWTTVRNVE